MKKVALYIRVPLKNKVPEQSAKSQWKLLKDFADDKNYQIEEVYTDGGYSGVNMERPALKRVLNDLKLKKFDVILVKDECVLSRDVMDHALIRDLCNREGVVVEYTKINKNSAIEYFVNCILGKKQQFKENKNKKTPSLAATGSSPKQTN